MPPQAILFDLDGTLLPLEFNDFVGGYFAALETKFRDVFPEGSLAKMIMASTQKMLANDGTKKNSDAFWEDFVVLTGRPRQELEPMFEEFYQKDFAGLCPGDKEYFPEACQVVTAVR
ncbi:MAG: HAD family hydrolase, partial [Actinomycetota bacterium]